MLDVRTIRWTYYPKGPNLITYSLKIKEVWPIIYRNMTIKKEAERCVLKTKSAVFGFVDSCLGDIRAMCLAARPSNRRGIVCKGSSRLCYQKTGRENFKFLDML